MISTESKKRPKKTISLCPICNLEINKDLLSFFSHLNDVHYPGFQYLNGHFIHYQDGKLLDLKTRNIIESFSTGLLIHEADKYLKRKKGEATYQIDKCSRCKISKSLLAKYLIDKKYEFLICKRCKRSLLKTQNHVRIIYNATELGKR